LHKKQDAIGDLIAELEVELIAIRLDFNTSNDDSWQSNKWNYIKDEEVIPIEN